MALAREGVARFSADAPLYIRPMYWADAGMSGGGVMFDPDIHPLVPLPLRGADAGAAPARHHAVAVPPPDPRDRAGRRQGRLPLSQQRPRPLRGGGARLRQLPR